MVAWCALGIVADLANLWVLAVAKPMSPDSTLITGISAVLATVIQSIAGSLLIWRKPVVNRASARDSGMIAGLIVPVAFAAVSLSAWITYFLLVGLWLEIPHHWFFLWLGGNFLLTLYFLLPFFGAGLLGGALAGIFRWRAYVQSCGSDSTEDEEPRPVK